MSAVKCWRHFFSTVKAELLWSTLNKRDVLLAEFSRKSDESVGKAYKLNSKICTKKSSWANIHKSLSSCSLSKNDTAVKVTNSHSCRWGPFAGWNCWEKLLSKGLSLFFMCLDELEMYWVPQGVAIELKPTVGLSRCLRYS